MTNKLNEVMYLRASKQEKREIFKRAKKAGKSVSRFMIEKSLDANQ